MAEQIDRLIGLRRLDSEIKAARVIAALDALASSGHAVRIATLARRANVSRRFIYDHPELRAEAERRAAEVANRHTGAMQASARVTGASLRADLENAKAKNYRLEQEHAALRQRLGAVLGHEVMAEMSDRGIVDTDQRAAARVGDLEQQLFDTGEELARSTEELEAARQINRELMARLNRERA
jgi:hypothetical protein